METVSHAAQRVRVRGRAMCSTECGSTVDDMISVTSPDDFAEQILELFSQRYKMGQLGPLLVGSEETAMRGGF